MSAEGLDADTIRECIAVVPYEEGVQIEFHCCGWDFEMAFTADGRIQDLSMEPARERRP